MDFSSYVAESKEILLIQIATVWLLGAWMGQLDRWVIVHFREKDKGKTC